MQLFSSTFPAFISSVSLPRLSISLNYFNFCSHCGRSITCIVKFLLLFYYNIQRIDFPISIIYLNTYPYSLMVRGLDLLMD